MLYKNVKTRPKASVYVIAWRWNQLPFFPRITLFSLVWIPAVSLLSSTCFVFFEFIWGEELRETFTVSLSERTPDLFPLLCRYWWALVLFVNTFRVNGFCLDLITDGVFSPPQGSSGLTSVGIWLLTWLGIFSVWLAGMSAFLWVKDQVVFYCFVQYFNLWVWKETDSQT